MPQAQQDLPAPFQVEVDTDHVQHGPGLRLRPPGPYGRRRNVGGQRMIGGVLPQQFPGRGQHRHVRELFGPHPGEHHGQGEGQAGRVAVPEAGEQLDRHPCSVGAGDVLDRVRLQVRDRQAGLPEQLPTDRAEQGTVLRLPAAAEQRPAPGLPDPRLVRVPQVQQVQALPSWMIAEAFTGTITRPGPSRRVSRAASGRTLRRTVAKPIP